MTEDTNTNTNTNTNTTTTEDKKSKTPRARWTEAMQLRLSANKVEGSAPLVLLTGLVACNIAHSSIDSVIRAPAGTMLAYLKTGAPVAYEVQTETGTYPVEFGDAYADAIIDKLVALKNAGAFTPRGLDLEAVLSVLLGTDGLTR
jgi:hypothetical protein